MKFESMHDNCNQIKCIPESYDSGVDKQLIENVKIKQILLVIRLIFVISQTLYCKKNKPF